MKTIELSDSESARWDAKGKVGKAFHQEVRDREQTRANRLGTPVEVFHRNGKQLMVLQPNQSGGHCP